MAGRPEKASISRNGDGEPIKESPEAAREHHRNGDGQPDAPTPAIDPGAKASNGHGQGSDDAPVESQ